MINYVLFKIIFMGAIFEPKMEELLIWIGWFTIIGFLRIFSMLCRDRFEDLMVSPNMALHAHRRMYGLLMIILVSDVFWAGLCIMLLKPAGWSFVLLLIFEVSKSLGDDKPSCESRSRNKVIMDLVCNFTG
jgi:autocrine motility factor receptor